MEAPPTSPEYPIAKLRGPSFSLRKGGGAFISRKGGLPPPLLPLSRWHPTPGRGGCPMCASQTHPCLPATTFPESGPNWLRRAPGNKILLRFHIVSAIWLLTQRSFHRKCNASTGFIRSSFVASCFPGYPGLLIVVLPRRRS